MYTVTYNAEKNRIYIEIQGSMSEEEFEAYKNDILDLIDNCSAGFTVLARMQSCDISVLQSFDKFNVIRAEGIKKGFKSSALILSAKHYEQCNNGVISGLKNIFLTEEAAEKYLEQV